jgi:hypothetical protein
MNRILGVMALSLCLLFPVVTSAADPGMAPGLWEITTVMEMPGLPFQPPPTTFSHCYTKEDVQKQEEIVPSPEGDCKVTDLKRSGNRMTWKMICQGANAGKGEGEIIFKNDTSYAGTMKLESQGMNLTTRYQAKRIGDCK